MDVTGAETFILTQLRHGLSETLYYHSLNHVLDVVDAAMALADQEGVSDPEQLALLKTAALYHDCGFMTSYQGHEEVGCDYVQLVLPQFDYSDWQIDIICGLIRATKVPQEPQTHLERILCDADLDYLGRDDFQPIAYSLFRELQARNMVTDEATWNRIQVRFLESHHYWTPTAIRQRQAEKAARLAELRVMVEQQTT